jgi:predicted DNA-binding WGR domain protein
MCTNFIFIGWNNEEGHDKVWAAVEVEGCYYAAWGRRGKKLQFKRHSWSSTLNSLAFEKQTKKGYKEVEAFLLFTIFPDFEERLEEELLMASMAGKVK